MKCFARAPGIISSAAGGNNCRFSCTNCGRINGNSWKWINVYLERLCIYAVLCGCAGNRVNSCQRRGGIYVMKRAAIAPGICWSATAGENGAGLATAEMCNAVKVDIRQGVHDYLRCFYNTAIKRRGSGNRIYR